MQDVARTAGVSKGIIHYYFLSKDDLMMCVLDRVAGDIEGVLAEDMKSIDDPAKKLDIFMSVSFDVVRSRGVLPSQYGLLDSRDKPKEGSQASYIEALRKFRDTCASVIEEGCNAGVFKDVNAHVYASFVISVIGGVSLQWLFDENVFKYEEVVKTSKDMILKGILK